MSIDATGSVWGIIPEHPKLELLLPQGDKIAYSKWLDGYFPESGSDFNGNSVGAGNASADPMVAYNYLSNKLNMRTVAAQQRPMLRIADQNLKIMFELTSEMSCEQEELMADTGQARLVCVYENWVADWILNRVRIESDIHLVIDPVPTQRTWRTRWGGKIHQINVARNPDGTTTLELVALSSREHAKNLLFACNPWLLPEVQMPKMWVLPGPIRSVMFMSCFINLARLFMPGLSGLTNAFNPMGWIDPLSINALNNVDPMSWPIQIAFVNPVLDQSRWTVLGSTWNDWHSATVDILKDTGNILRAYTWLVDEDIDSPHNELTDLFNDVDNILVGLVNSIGFTETAKFLKGQGDKWLDSLARPKRSCIIFRTEDMSGQSGPTGTAADGILNAIGVTLDDLFTSILVNADTGQTLQGEPVIDVIQPETPIFEALLDVAPAIPKVIWREGDYDRVPMKKHTLYKAPPRTIMTGGRSPTVVNQTQDFLIQYSLAQLSDMFNPALGSASLGAVNTAWQTPLSNGLGFLYQGQLDNTFLAWQRITLPGRALFGGDLAYQEYLEHGSGTAYTLAAIVSIREAAFKTRPYYGFQTQVISGWPWVIDVDVRLGERAGWEMDGVIYVDQITAIKRTWSRQNAVLPTLSVGDDQDREDPIARGIRALQSVYSIVSSVMGQGTLFG